jgi:hypothetical protein
LGTSQRFDCPLASIYDCVSPLYKPEALMSEPITAKPAAQTPALRVERRVWVRYPCDLDTAFQPLMSRTESQWPGRIHNISRGGMALTLRRRFEPGTLLSIHIQVGDESTPVVLVARVARVSPRHDQTWLVGCQFTSPLADEDLQALL